MSRLWLTLVIGALACASRATPSGGGTGKSFGLGRAATPQEVAALDVDAGPDGAGLPAGHGSAADGAVLYAARCASCHGDKGQGIAPYPALIGRDPAGESFDFASDAQIVKTIGNYWPYASTLFDYTARSMPFQQPGSLTANEVYAVVAYLLHLNELVPADAVMDRTTLPKVAMPARDRFVRDNRAGGKVIK